MVRETLASSVAIEATAGRIRALRGQRVMLDADLGALYGVTTKRLNEQVRKNIARFPEDSVFGATDREVENLRSQFATSNSSTLRSAWKIDVKRLRINPQYKSSGELGGPVEPAAKYLLS